MRFAIAGFYVIINVWATFINKVIPNYLVLRGSIRKEIALPGGLIRFEGSEDPT